MTTAKTIAPEITTDKALENEAEETTVVTIDYEGEKYTFDIDDMDDVEFMLAMEKEQLATAIQMLLGKAAFNKFLIKGKNGRRKLMELTDFVELMFEEKGVTPGE